MTNYSRGVSQQLYNIRTMFTYLFLLHELRVRTVIHNIASKDGSREWAIYLLRVDIFQFAVEDEVVPFRSKTYGGLLSKEDKSKDVAILSKI